VGLVDHETPDAKLGHPVQEAGSAEALGCHVEQPEPALGGRLKAGQLLGPVLGRVEEGGGHAQRPQAVDLVLHEGDEGGDDQRESAPDHGGHPVADALARSGRRHGEHVAAGELSLHDLFLAGPEFPVAEDVFEDRLAGAGHESGVCGFGALSGTLNMPALQL